MIYNKLQPETWCPEHPLLSHGRYKSACFTFKWYDTNQHKKGSYMKQKQGYRKFQIVELDLDKEVGETEPI